MTSVEVGPAHSGSVAMHSFPFWLDDVDYNCKIFPPPSFTLVVYLYLKTPDMLTAH